MNRNTIVALIAILGLIAFVSCQKAPETESPVRSMDNNFVTLKTNHGNLTLELYRDIAPAHADSFLARTNDGFYDGLKFFRVIKGFMMQSGDPQNMGIGGPGYTLGAEFSELPHVQGTLSMARSRDPNSAGSQFFLCFANRPSLDGQYTVFGHLVSGYDALRSIEDTEVAENPRTREMAMPVEDVIIEDAYQSDPLGNQLQE